MTRTFMARAGVGAALALAAAPALAQSRENATRIGELLADGFAIVDYEVGSISINRFQAFERILLVKDEVVFTCSLTVESGEDGPRKISVCTQIY